VRTLLSEPDQPIATLQHLLAHLLNEEAFFEAMLGRHEVASQFIQEAIGLAQGLADPALEALGHLRLGDIAWIRADYPTHRTAYMLSLTLVRQSTQRSLEAHCLSNLGMSHEQLGEYAEAIAAYEAALTIARELGNRQQESIVYNNLGVSYKRLGDFGKALQYYQQTLQLSRELGDQEGVGFTYLNQGSLWGSLGEKMRAQAALDQALATFRTIQLARLEAKTLVTFAILYEQLGDYALALDYCVQGLTLAAHGGYQTVVAEAQTLLGYIYIAQEEFPAAIEAHNTAYALWQTIDRGSGYMAAQAGLAQIFLRQQQYMEAQQIVNEILAKLDDVHLNALQHAGHIFMICYQTLVANHDPRAFAILQRGCQLLQAQAATLSDPALQQSFLHNILVNRELMAELSATVR